MSERKGPQWTEEQKKVIDRRRRSLLVSAAAGSGKTAVLVERIISMVTDKIHPLDIDHLLVVTFTNAAAAEMRERIGIAIEKALQEDPQNIHLQRQITLLHNAQITTIDSFCMNVIRSNFHRINLEPGFRIADEGELKLLKEDVADQVLEICYEKKEETFLRLVSGYSTARNDDNIREMMLKLYEFSQSYPWPEEWLDICEEQYLAADESELEQKPWVSEFLKYLNRRITDLTCRYSEMLDITRQPDGPWMYEEAVADDIRLLNRLALCRHLSEFQAELSDLSFTRLGNSRKYEGSKEKQERVKNTRDSLKTQLNDLKKKYFMLPVEDQITNMGETSEMVRELIRLSRSFAERFSEEKSRRNLIDFSDGEHFALNVLIDPVTKEYTDAAKEYRAQFAEIMIDEYQDSNFVQEQILTAVSGIPEGRQNMFMVGDVKQSIYRFRLARPELFIGKYASFSEEECDTQRIDLHKNFRSRREVLDITNDIFFHIMGKDLGDVEYDAQAALYPGREDTPDDTDEFFRPEMILIDPPEMLEAKEAEALATAGRILELVKGSEGQNAEYRDIVILLRSLSGWAEAYQRVFEQMGIPLIVSSRTGYFSAQEVQVILAMLRVLDNPAQDIPLTTVMHSYIGGFSSGELAKVRSLSPDLPFYACVMEYDASDETGCRIRKLRELLNHFRERVPYTPIHRLIQQILEETGYRDYVSALPAGEQRRANLDMLVEKAVAYEDTSYHGLYHFVRYVDRMIKYDQDFGEAEIVSDQENAVRLMTIHKSKGLEFPIVFVGGMGKQFNMQDAAGAVLFHPRYGIGMKWCDGDKRIRQDTLIRKVFSLDTRKDSLGEELRILYVAMTRAKEKLILIGKWDKKDKTKMYPLPEKEEKLDFTTRMDAMCYWDWVMPAVYAYGDKYTVDDWDFEKQAMEMKRAERNSAEEKQLLLQKTESWNKELYESLDRELSWTYPHQADADVKQKVSVSELKHRGMEEAMQKLQETTDAVNVFAPEIPAPYVPDFVRQQEENKGALFGTCVHRFMECLDFGSVPSSVSGEVCGYLALERARILESGKMTREDLALIRNPKIVPFLCSDVGRRMSLADKKSLLFREQPFVMSVSAVRVNPDSNAESSVLVQGIIDVFWEEEDGIVLLDYKTDHVTTPADLVTRYQTQLLLYAESIGHQFPEKPVKQILIYSFHFDQFIEIQEG